MRKIIVLFFGVLFSSLFANSQSLNFKLSGYLDTYYVVDNDESFDALSIDTRSFSYINKQKDEFRLNVAQLQGVFSYENRVRGNITIHTGDLLHTAWEEAGATNPTLQQANAGFMALENFWIDAGYFLTHIGGELLLPKDNWITSYSLVTFFEPFYQTGVKFSYETAKFTVQLHLLNGNGIFEDNNYNKSVGLYLNYNLNDNLSFTYANVFGNEEAGIPSNSRLLMYHNFDVYCYINDKIKVKGQIDYSNLAAKQDIKSQSFIGLSAEAQYSFLPKHAATIRGSYISTNEQLFIGADNGYEIALGVQFKPAEMAYIRLEARRISFNEDFRPFHIYGKQEPSRLEAALNFGVVLE